MIKKVVVSMVMFLTQENEEEENSRSMMKEMKIL